MLLWLGSASKQIPNVFPTNIIRVFDADPGEPVLDRGSRGADRVTLAALFRWTRFGLATRAAAENEVFAMLAGLSPNQLDGQHRARIGARRDGHRRGTLAQANSTTLVLFIVPALAAALFAGFTSLWIALLAGFGIGIGHSLVSYATTLSWFPTDGGNPLPGTQALLTFLLLLVALSLRGASLPTRGELVEKRLPAAPRIRHLARSGRGARRRRRRCARGAAVRLPAGADAVSHRHGGLPVAGRDHGFVGQVSLVQVTLAGVSGFVVSHMIVDAGVGFPWGPIAGLDRRCGGRPDRRCIRIAGPRRQPAVVTLAGVVAIEQFGFANSRWGAGPRARPSSSPACSGSIWA